MILFNNSFFFKIYHYTHLSGAFEPITLYLQKTQLKYLA